MACCRKSLTVGCNYLSRQFHPSFFHLLQDDRERSGAPQPLPLPLAATPRRASSSQLFDRFRSPVLDRRRLGFSLPIVFDHHSRNYSSSPEGSNEIGYINDVADVLTETTVDTSAVATAASASSLPAPFPGEVAAAAADSFLPVAALQHLIDAVHSFTGLNWWASIALTTVLIRGATVPLLINQLKASAKLNIMRPELEKLKEELNNNMDPEFLQEGQKRMKALFKKHGVTPFTPLKGALIQGPIFISFFFAISNMVEKVPSFKGGGAFWFSDLTTPDPMYIFPVLTSLTFLATVELNMQEGMEGNHMANTMKNFSRVLALLTVPFTASFPKAIFCYWVTSNLFSLMYGFVLKRPPVRKFLNLPDAVPKLELSSQTNFSLFGTSKPVDLPSASTQENGSTPVKSPEQRLSSSAVISQRIKNLEKTVKARNKYKKSTKAFFRFSWLQILHHMLKESTMATGPVARSPFSPATTDQPASQPGIGKKLSVVALLAIGLGSWFYAAIQPPEPRPCGSEGGPPVTAPRIRLRDGRHLAYAEKGVPKEMARFKIIFCHSFSGTRLDGIRASPETMEELGVYLVSYDRAGYGESDPNPRRSLRSEASDIEDLADALELGSRFYLISLSIGGHGAWASIKYIPQRLAGVALLTPVINYWWPGFPKNLSQAAYKQQHVGDQWSLRISYYAPWLINWWMSQSWLPTSTVAKGTTYLPNRRDAEYREFAISNGIRAEKRKLATQQGIQESYYRDLMVMFGKWEFDPMDLQKPPFPVHLWQGDEDGLVPVSLQRYLCQRLSWIQYHELPMTGHYLSVVPGFGDLVLKTLLVETSL